MYKVIVIKDIQIHTRGQLHVVRMSLDKGNILDILGGTHAHDGGIHQRDIAKATSASRKTTGARDLQVTR